MKSKTKRWKKTGGGRMKTGGKRIKEKRKKKEEKCTKKMTVATMICCKNFCKCHNVHPAQQ
jgi:hypothetical protein